MAMTTRLRRSILYMPGSNARALEKGRGLAADGLILDLEDAVAPDAKERARSQITDALNEGGYGHRELIVRVNAMDTPWGKEDIAAMATSGAHGILLTKVDSAAMVQEAEALMAASNAPDDMTIWTMMETPLGILHSEEIAFSSPRMGAFVLGTSDLAKDLHCAHTRERLPLITSLELCMLAARAAGIAVIDGVHLDLADDEGFEYSCRQGQEMGFDGKTLIHPKTIEMANNVYAPSEDDLQWSRTIIAAHGQAEKEGQGVIVVEGKLIENLHVENAKRLVAMADAIAAAGRKES
jgi:citrate lyase subunit beta/citryl-CoA lyase